MMRYFTGQLLERILFTLIVVGVLLGLYSIVRIVTISIDLSHNIAQQIHDKDEEINIQSTAEGRGLVTADLERRKLVKTRGQMIMAGGISLVMLGIGWLGYDLLKSRQQPQADVGETAAAEG